MPAPSLRLRRLAWCLFDFANSAFNTVVVTFVYAAYFAGTLVGDQQRGDVLWARMLAVSGVAVAFLAPFAGARADRTANKRGWLIGLSLATVACTAALFWPAVPPGAAAAPPNQVVAALLLVGGANLCFELMFVFYNAFLPELAGPREVGRLSGHGWALGYVGGLSCLALCLGLVGVDGVGPWLPTDAGLNVRATNLLVAGWFALFALPMFLWVKDAVQPGPAAATSSWRQLRTTLAAVRQTPGLLLFLVARLLYNDALVALIALAGLYMSGTLQMQLAEIMVVAIGLNVLAGLGALVFGHVDDRFGPKRAVCGSLLLLIAGCALAIAVPSRTAFYAAAVLVGLGLGPNQSASRTWLARMVPVERSAEAFGLFALSGKATVWLGPLLFAIVRDATGSQRLALVPLLAMFVLGLGLVMRVRG